MGCPADDVFGEYAVLPSHSDSLRVEFILKESPEKFAVGFSAQTPPPKGYSFYSDFAAGLENADELDPTLVFDSLWIYRHVDGLDSLEYSGVNGSDWTLLSSEDGFQSYRLDL